MKLTITRAAAALCALLAVPMLLASCGKAAASDSMAAGPAQTTTPAEEEADNTVPAEEGAESAAESAVPAEDAVDTTADSADSQDDAWKADFEKSLEENYDVTPEHYEDLGDGLYQVYVEIDGESVPYVVVDSRTGEYHG